MERDKDPRVPVRVTVEFLSGGDMIPREIVWIGEDEEEIRYRIDRVKDVCQAAAPRAGGQGDRYTVVINGRETYLYFERSADLTGRRLGVWFVERRSA